MRSMGAAAVLATAAETPPIMKSAAHRVSPRGRDRKSRCYSLANALKSFGFLTISDILQTGGLRRMGGWQRERK